jgi:hypothetical protein
LHRNFILKHITEGKLEGKRRKGRRLSSYQMVLEKENII